MKKYLNYAFFYSLAAMAGGVFYREFTKWNGFTGRTMLGKVHTHFFLLGMIVFMLVALFAKEKDLRSDKKFRTFLCVYNIGVPLTALMMLVRGITEVLHITLSTAVDACISGVAGVAHILMGLGLVLLFLSLKKQFEHSAS